MTKNTVNAFIEVEGIKYPWYDAARLNVSLQHVGQNMVNSLHQAVCAFEWGKTKEGNQYWLEISRTLIK